MFRAVPSTGFLSAIAAAVQQIVNMFNSMFNSYHWPLMFASTLFALAIFVVIVRFFERG